MEYRVEFKLAVDNHEAEYFKMAHLKPEELARAQDRICGILSEYLPPMAPGGVVKEAVVPIDRMAELLKKYVEHQSEPESEPTPDNEPEPSPAPEPAAPATPPAAVWRPGYKGIIRLVCPGCGKAYVNFFKDFTEHDTCKDCGADVPMTEATMTRFEFGCTACGKRTYGYTNDTGAGFDDFRCTCGQNARLLWNGKLKMYTGKELR